MIYMIMQSFKLVPMEKERLVEVVEDINNEIIVAGGVDVGSREFIVNENNLLGYTCRGDCTIGDVPCEVKVRIFTMHH